MFRYIGFLLTGLAMAQATDPISDKLRYDVAAAQVEYLVAKAQFEAATIALQEKIAEAQKLCGDKHFDQRERKCQ